eukprot:m.65442 g.65442  ORF g.65442 m.65442 type:complete len:342 (+) comp13666_c0_seq1:48-1073(+)
MALAGMNEGLVATLSRPGMGGHYLAIVRSRKQQQQQQHVDGAARCKRPRRADGKAEPREPAGDATGMNALPSHVLVHIFRFLPLEDLVRCQLVCRWFWQASREHGLWLSLCRRDFCQPPAGAMAGSDLGEGVPGGLCSSNPLHAKEQYRLLLRSQPCLGRRWLRCADCKLTVCPTHLNRHLPLASYGAAITCRVCSLPRCPSQFTTCRACDTAVCEDCTHFCEMCEAVRCLGCDAGGRCAVCNSTDCSQCAFEAMRDCAGGCGGLVCASCVPGRECQACDGVFCARCAVTQRQFCYHCTGSCCRSCADVCPVNGSRSRCPLCQKCCGVCFAATAIPPHKVH